MTNIRIPTKVLKLEEKTQVVKGWVDPITKEVNVTRKSLGWFVHFEGSYEALFVGWERPEGLEPETEVDIIIIPKNQQA